MKYELYNICCYNEMVGNLDLMNIEIIGDENVNGDGLKNVNFTSEKSMELMKNADDGNKGIASGTKSSKYDFEFDRVFEPGTSQEVVYEEISQLVRSSMDGYNVCVFAYGQTGSGNFF